MPARARQPVSAAFIAACLILVVVALGGCGAVRRDPGVLRSQGTELEQASLDAALGGDLTRALALEQQALAAYRRVDDTRATAGALNRLGNILQRMGRTDEARRAYLEARSLARQREHTEEEAAAESNLGTLYELLGDRESAAASYKRARALAERAGGGAVLAAVLNNQALMSLDAGDIAGARQLLEQALALDRKLGDRAGEADRLRNLGALTVRAGDDGQAIASFGQARALDSDREDAGAVAIDLVALSEARVRSGKDLERAIGERRRALEIHLLLGRSQAAARDRQAIGMWCKRLPAAPPVDCQLPPGPGSKVP